MAETETGRQLGVAVREALAPAAGYLALVTLNNPAGSADELLRRPDTSAVLADALGAARDAAIAVVQQEWFAAGAAPDSLYQHLLSDVSRTFDALSHLRGLVRHAHASVPLRWFVPGASTPGANPAMEAAAERSAAVRDAILGWARQAALRTRMTVSMAEGAGLAHAALADAMAREAAGERLEKRWRAQRGCCMWCRRLDGITIGLHESFAPYLGGPVAVPVAQARRVATPAGERRFGLPKGAPLIYTHPPRLYHEELQGPLLHPFCRCRLEITRAGGPATSAGGKHGGAGQPGHEGFLTAAAIRAIPEDQYQAQLAFMQAAVHELGAVLRKMSEGRRA